MSAPPLIDRADLVDAGATPDDDSITAAEAAAMLTEAFHGGHAALHRFNLAREGQAFQARLGRSIIRRVEADRALRAAPPEVIGRTLHGETVARNPRREG